MALAYGKLGYSREEFFDLSWYEFYRAAEGYYDHLKLMCPHLSFDNSKKTVSDERRKQVKKKTAHLWKKYKQN